jgi:hypothetical protein
LSSFSVVVCQRVWMFCFSEFGPLRQVFRPVSTQAKLAVGFGRFFLADFLLHCQHSDHFRRFGTKSDCQVMNKFSQPIGIECVSVGNLEIRAPLSSLVRQLIFLFCFSFLFADLFRIGATVNVVTVIPLPFGVSHCAHAIKSFETTYFFQDSESTDGKSESQTSFLNFVIQRMNCSRLVGTSERSFFHVHTFTH